MAAGKLSLCGNSVSKTELDGVRQSQNTEVFFPTLHTEGLSELSFHDWSLCPVKSKLFYRSYWILYLPGKVPQYISESHQVTLIYLFDLHVMILTFQIL